MNTKENQVFSLLLIEHIFSKKATKQKTKRRRSMYVNCMYTSMYTNCMYVKIVFIEVPSIIYMRS